MYIASHVNKMEEDFKKGGRDDFEVYGEIEVMVQELERNLGEVNVAINEDMKAVADALSAGVAVEGVTPELVNKFLDEELKPRRVQLEGLIKTWKARMDELYGRIFPDKKKPKSDE
jgi:hypothetical protein